MTDLQWFLIRWVNICPLGLVNLMFNGSYKYRRSALLVALNVLYDTYTDVLDERTLPPYRLLAGRMLDGRDVTLRELEGEFVSATVVYGLCDLAAGQDTALESGWGAVENDVIP